MSTAKPKSQLDVALAGIPKKFRDRLIATYSALKRRHLEARHDNSHDSAGLSASKFCETLLRYLQEELTGSSIPFGVHIPNLPDECRKLITLPATAGIESFRIILPRAISFLYTLRGKRGIGHVAGDVDANHIDLEVIVRTCDWIMCELIRAKHGLSLEEADEIIESVLTKSLPHVWEVAGRKRILRNDLDYQQKTLLLAYSESQTAVPAEDLFTWTEHSNFGVYKKTVLRTLHTKRLIEYDRETDMVFLSPLGVREVEDKLIDGK